MDSSNAEKAWEAFAEKHIDEFIPAPIAGGMKFSFNSGRASRDAEVSEPTRLLAESRARFGDSEARRAELEAVITEALAVEDKHPDTAFYVIVGHMRAALMKARSVVLEDRDRENRAIGWDEAAVGISTWPGGDTEGLFNPYRGDTT